MSVLDQIAKSRFSKGGQTSVDGVFEGTPQNVAAVIKGSGGAKLSTPGVYNTQPVDSTQAQPPQPTYLDYLKTMNKI